MIISKRARSQSERSRVQCNPDGRWVYNLSHYAKYLLTLNARPIHVWISYELYLIIAVLLESDLSELTEEARRVYERHCRRKSQIVIFLTDLRKNPIFVLVS